MTWHTVTSITKEVYRISEPIGVIEPRFGVLTVNMYLVIGQEQAALIDTGKMPELIRPFALSRFYEDRLVGEKAAAAVLRF